MDNYTKKKKYGYRAPDFFSSTLTAIINSMNYIYIMLSIFSFILFVFFHYFALNFISDTEAYEAVNSSLIKTNLSNLVLIGIVALSYYTLSSKNVYLFGLYTLSIVSFTIMTIRRSQIGLINYFNYIYTCVLLLSIIALGVYSGLFYLKSIGYMKYNLNSVPVETIIHETKLRIDMAKINYNALIIRLGLHKISKKLLFTPKDYYFMNIDKERENNEKIKNENFGESSKSQSYCEESTFANTTCDNEYSRLDGEEEPLKI